MAHESQPPARRGSGLTHFDDEGNAVMVDVTDKSVTLRSAEAHCVVHDLVTTDEIERDGDNGPVLAAARIAALQGAKQTSKLIPLCHPLPLTNIEVEFSVTNDAIAIKVITETRSQTGVEMEALTACGIAALSIASQLRGAHPDLVIGELALWEKSGGRSGHWVRDSSKAKTSNR
jgi:cyclic pyranopterin phosphate synthase